MLSTCSPTTLQPHGGKKETALQFALTHSFIEIQRVALPVDLISGCDGIQLLLEALVIEISSTPTTIMTLTAVHCPDFAQCLQMRQTLLATWSLTQFVSNNGELSFDDGPKIGFWFVVCEKQTKLFAWSLTLFFLKGTHQVNLGAMVCFGRDI